MLQWVWPWQGLLCPDKTFLCRDRVWSRSSFICRDRAFLYRDRVGQGKEILCRDREFDVMTELPKITSRQSISYVATKRVPGHEVFHIATVGHEVASQQGGTHAR